MLPPAQAGVSLSIGQSLFPLAGTECPAIRSYQLGTPAPNTTDPGESLTSGVAGTSIQCSVTVQQSGYLFSAQIRGVTSDGNAVSLVLTTGSTVGASSGSADVSVYTAALIQTYSSPAPCQFQILSQQIKPGSIWASFSCEQVASPPSGLCQLTGTVLLENCAQF
jgi:hypothetical protein